MLQIIQSKHLENILSKEQIKMFANLQIILKKLNKISNLTKLLEGNDYWISHVYDSVWPLLEDSKTSFDKVRFIDIGSGCGFPGLAYAITHPHSEVYLVDSSKKKTEALKNIVKEMNFKNKIFVIKDRIENLAYNSIYRNNFNLCTVRAVSTPSTVAEYSLPLLKKTGCGIIYCGRWGIEDQKKLQNALFKLKGSIKNIKHTLLPENKGERHAIFIEPKEICPKIYPRLNGKPAKYPL